MPCARAVIAVSSTPVASAAVEIGERGAVSMPQAGRPLRGCASARVAITCAARRLQDQAIVRRDALETLTLQFLSGAQLDAAARAGASARTTLRGVRDPL